MTVTRRVLTANQRAKITLNATVDASTAAIAKAWATAWEEVTDEWRSALAELASMADENGWPARYAALRVERAQIALRHTAEQLDKLAKQAGVTITRTLPDVAMLAETVQAELVRLQLPAKAGIAWNRLSPQAIEWMVERSTQQIESTLWPLSRDAQAVMRQTLLRGAVAGDNPRDVADLMLSRLEGDFNGGLRRAENIARTELLDAHRHAALESRKANRDVLTGWRWTATLNARTCPACLAMDGKVFDLDTPGPDDHQSGRCVAVPVTLSWADLGFDLPEPADDAPTGREWLEGQPERVQVDVLGRRRYDALKAGRIGWDDMAKVRRTPHWRDSVGVAPLPAVA